MTEFQIQFRIQKDFIFNLEFRMISDSIQNSKRFHIQAQSPQMEKNSKQVLAQSPQMEKIERNEIFFAYFCHKKRKKNSTRTKNTENFYLWPKAFGHPKRKYRFPRESEYLNHPKINEQIRR